MSTAPDLTKQEPCLSVRPPPTSPEDPPKTEEEGPPCGWAWGTHTLMFPPRKWGAREAGAGLGGQADPARGNPARARWADCLRGSNARIPRVQLGGRNGGSENPMRGAAPHTAREAEHNLVRASEAGATTPRPSRPRPVAFRAAIRPPSPAAGCTKRKWTPEGRGARGRWGPAQSREGSLRARHLKPAGRGETGGSLGTDRTRPKRLT